MTPADWSAIGFFLFMLIVMVSLYLYVHKDDFWGGGW